ncbi:MAG: hypothetical protein RSB85_02755, partial [Rikenellaceae bacterium]
MNERHVNNKKLIIGFIVSKDSTLVIFGINCERISPKIRHRECEDDCECHMSEKYFKEMNGAVDYLKDKLKDFKNSVSMEMGMDEDNINISCCSHDYCISKKHLALIGVG